MNQYHCYYLDGPRAGNLVSFAADPIENVNDHNVMQKLCFIGNYEPVKERQLATYKVFRCQYKGQWYLLASVREKLNNLALSLEIALRAGLEPHCINHQDDFPLLFEAMLGEQSGADSGLCAVKQ